MFTLEEKLHAVSLVTQQHMSFRQAARQIGSVSYETIRRWYHALNDHNDKIYSLVDARCRPKEMKPVDLDNLPSDPDELKRIIFDMQFELDLTNAVVDVLKKDPGVDPKTLPNKEKAILVDALAKRSTRYTISYLTSSLHLAPATFYYHKKRIGSDPEATLRVRVIKACAEHPMWGYRRIKALLDSEDRCKRGISEKRIRRIMYEEGLSVPRRRAHSRYSSYDARLDDGCALPNIPLDADGTHDFTSPVPNALWLTDVTEFTLPSSERVFLSPVLDCFDSSLTGWKASVSSKAEDLTNPSLEEAVCTLQPGERCTIHSDRGGQYFSKGWKRICAQHSITRSMSRKGHSPDNARMEGFFGRLKMEFFDVRDWEGVSAEQFIEELDAWLVYYNEKRPKLSLGWMSPVQYRKSYYDAA